MHQILWEETLPGAATWSRNFKRGTSLRLADDNGGANVAAMLYNSENPVERYNMPDTLKAQHVSRLTKNLVLYSDMGRVLASITHDSCGWHDPLSGHSTAALVRARYGEKSYQEARNDFHQNARDGFLIELAKYGLGERDLVANVNFFSKVEVSEDGAMKFVPGNSKAGNYVELRFEMNTLVILNTCQHPLDPARAYAPKPVQLTIFEAGNASPSDPCRLFHPENERGFLLTERYYL
jgi:uncharacterized protein